MLAAMAGESGIPVGETPGNGDAADDVENEERPVQKEPLHVVIDRKGRKGKTATIIEGFTLPDEEVETIASELKRKIGTGGSSRGGEILLQGEWRQKVTELLRAKGFKTKG